jgi:glycosyltransferase involved in cell wall biosynthesis
MLPKVSIVIPGYNCAKTISQTLEACLKQDFSKENLEIIFVDDGSTDNTADIVHKFPVKYIRQENSGPARARNRGWREASGEIILFTDADCRPEKDWIFSLIKNFEDSGIAAAGGSYGISNPQNFLARCIHTEIIWRHKKMPREVQALGSYNLAIPRRILQELNGFDENYLTSSGEDNDLCYRLMKKGYKLIFVPEALVCHHHPDKLFPYLKHQFRHGYWRMKLYRDHPKMMRGDDYSGLLDFLSPLIAIYAIIIFPLGGIDYINKAKFLLLVILIFIEAIKTLRIFSGRIGIRHFYLLGMLLLRDFWRGSGMFLGIIRFFILDTFKKRS